jgi:DNA polymerase-3 subunit alpha
VDTAKQLEHHARHVGVHAAGVVVATEPLDNIVPLCRATGSSEIVTQWDGPTCENVGLLKMDFLGLRTLSIIAILSLTYAYPVPTLCVGRRARCETKAGEKSRGVVLCVVPGLYVAVV